MADCSIKGGDVVGYPHVPDYGLTVRPPIGLAAAAGAMDVVRRRTNRNLKDLRHQVVG